jgi:hypothetical protein
MGCVTIRSLCVHKEKMTCGYVSYVIQTEHYREIHRQTCLEIQGAP